MKSNAEKNIKNFCKRALNYIKIYTVAQKSSLTIQTLKYIFLVSKTFVYVNIQGHFFGDCMAILWEKTKNSDTNCKKIQNEFLNEIKMCINQNLYYFR